MLRAYCAGPMRGYPAYNFPAFDAARDRLLAAGYEPVNPADLDRAVGITETTDPLPPNFMREAMARDLLEICKCDAIALLPGWQKSAGVAVELALAKMLKLIILDAITLLPMKETILEEAQRLVYGERNADYGHPLDDFTKTAALWSVIMGVPVTPEQVGLGMVAVKIARELHKHKRDNLVDGAGYFGTVEKIHTERDRRARLAAADAT